MKTQVYHVLKLSNINRNCTNIFIIFKNIILYTEFLIK